MLASESERLVLGELRGPQRAGGRQLRAAGSLLARPLTLALFPRRDSLAVTGSRASRLHCAGSIRCAERAARRPLRRRSVHLLRSRPSRQALSSLLPAALLLAISHTAAHLRLCCERKRYIVLRARELSTSRRLVASGAAGAEPSRSLALSAFALRVLVDALDVTAFRASRPRCADSEERAGLRPPRAAVRARPTQPTTLSSCGALAPAFSLTCSPFALLLSLPLHLARCAAVARANPRAALKLAAALDLAPLPEALESGRGGRETKSDVARECEASEESYTTGTPERERVQQAARRGGRDGDALVLVRGRASRRESKRKAETTEASDEAEAESTSARRALSSRSTRSSRAARPPVLSPAPSLSARRHCLVLLTGQRAPRRRGCTA